MDGKEAGEQGVAAGQLAANWGTSPETVMLAVAYVQKKVPIFAACETGIMCAFTAGYEAALQVVRELAEEGGDDGS